MDQDPAHTAESPCVLLVHPYRGPMVFRLFRAAMRLAASLIKVPLVPLWLLGRWLGRPRADWLRVDVRPKLAEVVPTRKAWMRFVPSLQDNVPTSLSALRRLADRVAKDDKIRGVAFRVLPLQSGWVGAAGLRDVFDRLRRAGKRVAVVLPDGGGNKEAYVASGADRVLLAPQASLMVLGVAAETRYVRPLLERLGVRFEVFARSGYKTALEPAVRDEMSPAQREQLTALLETFDRVLREALTDRPTMSEQSVDALFEASFVGGVQAQALGLVDAVAYEDELPALVRAESSAIAANTSSADDRREPRPLLDANRYLAFHEAKLFARLRPAPRLGLVELHGPIGSRKSANKAIAALRQARRDKRVRGVLLHIDSPGGSATVSDSIHREVIRLKEKKPVVAWFGEIAASGGYYVGVAADAIVAQPATITGSIGVIAARLVAEDLLQGLGIRSQVIRLAPHADMLSPSRAPTDAERAILDREVDAFYRNFIALVAAGRGMTEAQVEEVAQGRVWSGRDAHRVGLVDRLGGFDVALAELQKRVGEGELELERIEPRRIDIPPAEPFHQPLVDPRADPPLALLAALEGLVQSPHNRALLELYAGGHRVLPLALDLPQIR